MEWDAHEGMIIMRSFAERKKEHSCREGEVVGRCIVDGVSKKEEMHEWVMSARVECCVDVM